MRYFDRRGRFVLPLVLFLLLLAGCATATRGPGIREDANCAWRVCVTFVNTPSGRGLQAVNREPVPATIVLTFRSPGNLRPGADLPIERVVPPESSVILVHLRTIVQREATRPRVTIAIDLGSSSTEPDADHLYAVPFGGDARRELTQGFGGVGSHLANMSYSLDFRSVTWWTKGMYWAGAAQPASRPNRISISMWVYGCCVPRGVPFRSS